MKRIYTYLKENNLVLFKIFMIWQILLQWILAPVFPVLGKIGNFCIVGLAGVIYVYNFKQNGRLIKFGIRPFPCVFLGAVLFSIVLNYQVNLIDNLETYAILLIEMLILLPVFSDDTDRIQNDLCIFANGVAVLMFLCSIIGFILYIIDYPIYLYSNRFCGIFSNPNQSSIMAFWGMISSCVVLVYKKKSKRKSMYVFHIVNLILNFFMFTLSNSNTGKVMLIAMVCTIAFFVVWLKKSNVKIYLRVVLSIVVMLIGGIIAIGVYEKTQNALAYLPGGVELIDSSLVEEKIEDKIEDKIEKKSFDRSNQEGGLNNNRFEIWREGIETFKQSIIIGCGPRNISFAVNKYIKNPRSEIQDGGLHNMYLELLVACGILGFLSFSVLLLSKAIPVLRILFGGYFYSRQTMMVFVLLSASVVSFLGMNMTESAMLFSTSAYSLCFWCVLGYLMNLTKCLEVKRGEKE